MALIVGVGLGMWMGANEDFTLRPIHAHINLVGWASMMLMGFFYRLLPQAAGRLAWIQLAVFTLGFILMMTGLSAMLLGNEALLPLLLAGELLTGLGILMFAVILFRATGGREVAPA
ncbi:hypothetical protein ACIQC9_01215 [Brevundimonas sp. NPDC092305]|uniref:hypothetical protein n=1 Tax=Brevundimonas sp. NPDC092305 TaxID=3363957 RepID=UPI0038251876